MAEKVKVVLRDFKGETVIELSVPGGLPFPYLFYQSRLFVSSRDEANVLLERSYCIFEPEAPGQPRPTLQAVANKEAH